MTTPSMVTEALRGIGHKVSYSKHKDDGRGGLRGTYHVWKIGDKQFSIFTEAGRIFRADIQSLLFDARHKLEGTVR